MRLYWVSFAIESIEVEKQTTKTNNGITTWTSSKMISIFEHCESDFIIYNYRLQTFGSVMWPRGVSKSIGLPN